MTPLILLFLVSVPHFECSPLKSEILKTFEEPTEIQHAVCKVTTSEIEASAKATITKQLKGVCSTRELDYQFGKLEIKLMQELEEIKKGLGIKSLHQKQYVANIDNTAEYENDLYNNDKLKSLEADYNFENAKYDVKQEINDYNDTIVESSEGDIYLYYWKISDFRNILSKRNIYISSDEFSVLGHQIYLQFYPNYEPNLVGLLLKPMSNSFLKKHKFTFLGQDASETTISSKILYGLNNKRPFTINKEMIEDLAFKNSLLLKVSIYLDS